MSGKTIKIQRKVRKRTAMSNTKLNLLTAKSQNVSKVDNKKTNIPYSEIDLSAKYSYNNSEITKEMPNGLKKINCFFLKIPL